MLPPLRILSLVAATGLAVLLAFGAVDSCSRENPASPGELRAHALTPEQEPAAVRVPRPDPASLPRLSPDLPLDLNPDANAPSRPRPDPAGAADFFAWNTFVALNWPTTAAGQPERSQLIGQQGDNSTVWESWPEAAEASAPESAPDELRRLPPGTRVLFRVGKNLASLAPDAPHGPLVDQNGRHLRLEIRVSQTVLEALSARRREAAPTSAPAAPAPTSATTPDAAASEAIRIQAAWKTLSPAEAAAGRFHAIKAFVYTPPDLPEAKGSPGKLVEATLGLVGLHIVRKNPSAPGWIWSTFEHVDNCPTLGEDADRAAYNFYDKSRPDLPVNRPPAPPWNPASIEPATRRAQIVRQVPIPESTRTVSAAFQASLRAINPASPWQYYELVGTQVSSDSPEAEGAVVGPAHLANTTLEPYLATSASPAASCVACHGKAGASPGTGSPLDHSFLPRLTR